MQQIQYEYKTVLFIFGMTYLNVVQTFKKSNDLLVKMIICVKIIPDNNQVFMHVSK